MTSSSIEVSWSPPASNGSMYGYDITLQLWFCPLYIAGSDITSYIVRLERQFFHFDSITVGADVQSALFTGLIETTEYS